jgi:hypothetical protein
MVGHRSVRGTKHPLTAGLLLVVLVGGDLWVLSEVVLA